MTRTARRVAILIEQVYEDLEAWYPYFRLQEEGAEVHFVGPQAGETYPSKHGYPAVSDVAAGDVKAGDYDAVIVPGGFSPDFMRRSESMVQFMQDAVAGDLVIAAICHGGWMLCCTDVLKGRRATSFSAIRWDMQNAGAEWVDEECVVDGNLITSRKPSDLPAFCRAVLDKLAQQRSAGR